MKTPTFAFSSTPASTSTPESESEAESEAEVEELDSTSDAEDDNDYMDEDKWDATQREADIDPENSILHFSGILANPANVRKDPPVAQSVFFDLEFLEI